MPVSIFICGTRATRNLIPPNPQDSRPLDNSRTFVLQSLQSAGTACPGPRSGDPKGHPSASFPPESRGRHHPCRPSPTGRAHPVMPPTSPTSSPFALSEVEGPLSAQSKTPNHSCHTVTCLQIRPMSQMSHFCDIGHVSATKSCHSVRVSGQLAQCHRCHTFQLQKRVFSYDRCDIVTSATPPTPSPIDARPLHRYHSHQRLDKPLTLNTKEGDPWQNA